MIKNALANWRTTSAGLGMIVTSTVHLVFMIKKGMADETTWTREIIAIIGGFGLISAGDGALSKKHVEDVAKQVETNRASIEQIKGDTTQIKKS